MRHAVITAGSKGLGRKTTEALLKEGYSVTVQYRSDKEAAEKLLHDLAPYKDHIQLVQGDVQQKEDLITLIDKAYNSFGRIDVLVLNAGPYIFEHATLADYEEEDWHAMINGNLNAAFYLLKQTIPIMRKQKFGRIITFGFQDVMHTPGWLYRAPFAAAKVGLASLTKSISIEEASNGITANMICPGEILGEMKEANIEDATDDGKTPVGRSGTGEDISRAVLFLADEKAGLMTGSVIEVTGGLDVLHKNRIK
ncbi:SDR family oxidoreductase [Paenalkalicoccus suaedae]|uniref:SDR family oxidoreductase n=1 Tax=Paenalkalicoccus suaedae TaxID=2592382 RepID=A0A859FG98_9BACI|nr:SDR family oxidoreductase [Paenalkalicoccus suaedae]QKS72051.1 SDR family oxidoreductase [Paenalkalicoccus suaedae]